MLLGLKTFVVEQHQQMQQNVQMAHFQQQVGKQIQLSELVEQI
jgi:hypothetical protein